MKRVLFMGQKPLGQYCFSRLLDEQSQDFVVCGAVSNTTLENWWRDNAIARWCADKKLAFVSNERRNNQLIAELVAQRSVNIIISIQHAWIIPEEILAQASQGAFNLHLAKLPKYKGYYGTSHAILNNEKTYAVTLHWMVPEVDSGAIAYEETVPILERDTARSLYTRAETAGRGLFERLLRDLKTGVVIPKKPMSGEHRFFSRRALDSYRNLRPTNTPEEIDRAARALYFPPFEPAALTVGEYRHYLIPEEVWNR